MSGQRAIARLLTGVTVASVVLVLMVGVVGEVAALRSTHAVTSLTNELAPANRANNRVMLDLLNAETYLRGFVIADDKVSLAHYRSSLAQLGQDEAPLRSFADAHGPRLPALVREQRSAWMAWVHGYAEPRVARGGGEGTYQAPFYRRGVRLFDVVRRVNTRIARDLDQRQAQARADAQSRLHATNALLIAMAVLGAAFLFVLGRWIAAQVLGPLNALQDVVNRLAAGDHDARVRPGGPREVRRVGDAINDLADEADRGRAVEAAIQSQLREVDAAKSDFVSNVSHELRTPLTIITGYLELLEEELAADLDPDQQHMLSVTGRNVARLRSLIEDLLTLDRAEHSGTAMEEIDLVDVVTHAVSDLRLSATNQAVDVRLTVPPTSVIALADPGQLQRAVMNLISNAVKFSEAGDVVEITLDQQGADAVILVDDEGIGIPQDDLTKLGSRFFRASNAVRSEIAGTGLGLRIVQTIVMNHRGRLSLDSVEGEGTTVRIVLPLRPTPVEDDPAEAGTREETASLDG